MKHKGKLIGYRGFGSEGKPEITISLDKEISVVPFGKACTIEVEE